MNTRIVFMTIRDSLLCTLSFPNKVHIFSCGYEQVIFVNLLTINEVMCSLVHCPTISKRNKKIREKTVLMKLRKSNHFKDMLFWKCFSTRKGFEQFAS